MRVLLDESLPKKLKRELAEHTVATVPEAGWAGKKNGELLRMADAHFDVFVTPDRQIPSQQNLVGLRVGIIILRARSNDISDLLPLVPNLQATILRILPGQVLQVER